MPTSEFRLVHVTTRVQARGGLETLHEHQRAAAVDQHFVAFFDRGPQPRAGYTNLNFNWRTPLWRMRARFRAAMAAHAGAVVIYHDGWGLPLLHDTDGAGRRIMSCFGSPAYHAKDLRASAGLVDGVIVISPGLQRAGRAAMPGLAVERIRLVTVPIRVPAGVAARRRTDGEIVLGFAGRVERRHKRLDRLPEFLDELRGTGRKFRFEVLGTGLRRAALERRVGDEVKFHGWVTKEEFWRVLAGWDGVVFFSVMEGGPIALLEAAALGAIPFFPAIGGSLGDEYVPRVDARCHYPPGDLRALARAVAAVFAAPPAELAERRQRAQAAVAPHREARYGEAVAEFAREIAERPRAAPPRRRRPRLADALPLGWVTRLAPWGLRAG